MRVVGFTFIRNAIKYDYPILESILSIEPLCDEIIVAVGNSDDGTEKLFDPLSPKIKIIHTTWDDSKRAEGAVLAEETNKAFDAIIQADWCIYLQGDEVIHEKYHDIIRHQMQTYREQKEIEGFLLQYLHFYGSYDYVGDSRRWYRREIRIIRNDKSIRSYKDAQGFRKNGKKLKVKLIDAYVYHYGWVREPQKQQHKVTDFNKLWHSDEWVQKNIKQVDAYTYDLHVDALRKFNDSHPAVMQQRIKKQNWAFDYNINQKNLSIKDRLLIAIEKITGYRIGEYKNYKLI